MSKGYLYILIDPATPENLLKIGKSDRPRKTADRDDAPADMPYIACEVEVSDCDRAEAAVLNELKSFRSDTHPEYFRISPDQAARTLQEIASQMDKAVYYKKAVEKNPDNALLYNNLGCSHDRLGNPTAAIDAYKRAIELDPDNAVFYNNLGCSYGKLSLYRKSIDAFRQAIRIQPDFVKAYFDLGFSYSQLGSHQEAVEAFRDAIRINPDIAQIHYSLSHSYIRLGFDEKAVRALKDAIRINPGYVSAHYSLGLLYLRMDDKKAALKQFNLLKSLDEEKARELFNMIYRQYRQNRS